MNPKLPENSVGRCKPQPTKEENILRRACTSLDKDRFHHKNTTDNSMPWDCLNKSHSYLELEF